MTRLSFLSRKRTLLLFTLVATPMLCFAFPHMVSAQTFFVFDPTSAANSTVGKFLATSQAWGRDLYIALMVFDVFALAVAALLFRDNLGELFSGITLKFIIGNVFIYFIVNANTFFPGIVNGFSQAGQTAGGSTTSTPFELLIAGGGASYLLFSAADVAHAQDQAAAVAACATLFTCSPGAMLAAWSAHAWFITLCNGLALITLLSFVGIFLTYVLITIESYIVIFAGVFYLGFAGSKFTMPFSQGYLNYMISVGTKLFTMYLVMGIVFNILPGILLSAYGTFAAAQAIPLGIGEFSLGFVAAFAALQTLTAAALIYAIPQYSAAFLSGQSGASGNAFLGQIASSASGMQMMLNGFKGASMGGAQANQNALTQQQLNHGSAYHPGQVGQVGAGSDNQSVFAKTGEPPTSQPATTANNIAASTVGSGGGGLGSIGSVNGNGNSGVNGNAGRQDSMIVSSAAGLNGSQQVNGASGNVGEGAIGNGGGGLGSIGSVAGAANNANVSPPQANIASGEPSVSLPAGSPPSGLTYNALTKSFQPTATTGSGVFTAMSNAQPLGDSRQDLMKYSKTDNPEYSVANQSEALDRARATDFSTLSQKTWDYINATPELKEVVQQVTTERQQALDLQRDQMSAMGLQGLAIAVPRDSAPPTAAQIRLSNPDRL